MLSTAMYRRMPFAPANQMFTSAASDVIGVSGAKAQIRKYVDTFIKLNGTAVYYPLLIVVKSLAFSLLIGIDTLGPTARCSSTTRAPRCDCALSFAMFVVNNARISHPIQQAPITSCTATKSVIEPSTRAFIRVRVLRALCELPNVAVESLV